MASLTGVNLTGLNLADPYATLPVEVTNAEVVYLGGYYALSAAGRLTEMADTAGLLPLGLLVSGGEGAADAAGALPNSITGDTAASVPPRGLVNIGGGMLLKVPVAGASAIANVGDLVYLGTDNLDDLTTTATTNVPAIGRIVGFNSATSFDVRLFSLAELGGGAVLGTLTNLALGTVSSRVLMGPGAVTSANILAHTVAEAGVVDRLYWRPAGFAAGFTSGSIAVHLLNGSGLLISGGVFTVAFGNLDALGDVATENAVTLTNTSGRATLAVGDVIRLARKSGGLLNAVSDCPPINVRLRLRRTGS